MPRLRDRDGRGIIIWGRDGDEFQDGDKALIAAAPTMAQMLRELEWCGTYAPGHGLDIVDNVCPMCGASEPGYSSTEGANKSAHLPDCRLAALLKELP